MAWTSTKSQLSCASRRTEARAYRPLFASDFLGRTCLKRQRAPFFACCASVDVSPLIRGAFGIFRRAACTLDEELLQDYLFSYGWREANWGTWLAALAPSNVYATHLQTRRATLPHGSVVMDLSIASCGAGSAPKVQHNESLSGLGSGHQPQSRSNADIHASHGCPRADSAFLTLAQGLARLGKEPGVPVLSGIAQQLPHAIATAHEHGHGPPLRLCRCHHGDPH